MHFYISEREYVFNNKCENKGYSDYIARVIELVSAEPHNFQHHSSSKSTIGDFLEDKAFISSWQTNPDESNDVISPRKHFHYVCSKKWECVALRIDFGILFFFRMNNGRLYVHATEELIARFKEFDFHPVNYHPHYFFNGLNGKQIPVDDSFYEQDVYIRNEMSRRVNFVLFNDEPEKIMTAEEAFLSLAEEAFILVSEAADPETFYQSIKCHPDLDFLEDIAPMVIYLAQFFAEYEEVEIVRGLAKGEYVAVNNDYTSVCNIVESHLSTKRSYASNMEREYASLRTYIIDYRKKNTSFQRRMTTK